MNRTSELQRAYVGIGANLGDAQATVRQAMDELGLLPATRGVARSSLYRSAPVDAAGPDFINAVAALDTALSPEALLVALQQIEQRHHRERPYHHAPRTLDLDLLLVGDDQRDDPALSLPHPRLHLRAFVLEPLLEIEPALQHPRLGPLEPWRRAAAGQRVERLV
jgi:2-amino-4-hydroxy-6-hydroxymethyldihydropteridine diphosphokinase